MVCYCPKCRKLYKEPKARCDSCGDYLFFDNLKSKDVYLADGYIDMSSSAPAPLSSPKAAESPKKAEPPKKAVFLQDTPSSPPGTAAPKEEKPLRKTEPGAVLAPFSYGSSSGGGTSEPPRKTGSVQKTPPGTGKTVVPEDHSVFKTGRKISTPVPPPGFDGSGSPPEPADPPRKTGSVTSISPPPGFGGSGTPSQPPRSSSGGGHSGGGHSGGANPTPVPPPGFDTSHSSAPYGERDTGGADMPPPPDPHHGPGTVTDYPPDGHVHRPVAGRILLVLLLLGLVFFVLYMIMTMRDQLSGSLSSVVLAIIAIVVIFRYVTRRRR